MLLKLYSLFSHKHCQNNESSMPSTFHKSCYTYSYHIHCDMGTCFLKNGVLSKFPLTVRNCNVTFKDFHPLSDFVKLN